MQDNKPDIRRIEAKDTKKAAFPAQVDTEYRVFIHPEAYRKMQEHAATTNEVELCGVLIGEVCQDETGFFLNISAVIEGEGANNYGAQVTFTHDTWSHINKIKDTSYPQLKIVGWYHTHPGFGVFLSQMDSFIQENFFNLPYQVAIVIESKDGTEGCFCWQEGKSVPLSRYWVGNRKVDLITGTAKPFAAAPREPQETPPAELRSARLEPASGSMMLLSLLFAAAGLFFGLWWGSGQEHLRMLDTEVSAVIDLAAQTRLMGMDLGDVRTHLAQAQTAVQNNQPARATQELAKLDAFLRALQDQYTAARPQLRAQLQEIAARRETLRDRVDQNTRRSEDLSRYVGDLYLISLQQVVTPGAAYDPKRFPPQTEPVLRMLLDRAVMNHPENKHLIRQMYPGLIEYFYPEPAKAAGKS